MARSPRHLSRFATVFVFALFACASPGLSADSYPPKPGSPHPSLVLRTIEGDRVIALSSFRGKKVLLVHLASSSKESRRDLPVWHQQCKRLVTSGKLVVIGVAQEQDADRCKLFAQWRGIDWPILHDPLNLVGVESVPCYVAIDEHGIVRELDPDPTKLEASFVGMAYPKPKKEVPLGPTELPEPRVTRRIASEARSADAWREHGDALVLAGQPAQIKEAIDIYQRAIQMKPKDELTHFRVGVAYRIRSQSAQREPGDFQAAIEAWGKASRLDSKNEVLRRRVQQYGPCVDKPAAFYDWIGHARKEIIARDETPATLNPEPSVAERARPAREFSGAKKNSRDEPDDKIPADKTGLVQVAQAVVHGIDKKNAHVAQVHLVMRPSAELDVQWSSEGPPLRVWIKQPKSGKLSTTFVEYANPTHPAPAEDRTINFEISLSSQQKAAVTVEAVAVYTVIEGGGGKAQTLRQTIQVKVRPG